MSTSRYAVVRRLSRVFLLPIHGQNTRMHRRQGKDGNSMEDKRICTKENCLTCCKKFTAFMFSRVGLFFVMMGYVALGGVLFQELEAGNELNMRLGMNEKLTVTLNKLWGAILQANSLPEWDKRRNFSLNATSELEIFEKIVVQQVLKGFDGRTTDSDNDWNYFGAVLYAVTLISTIGYGHITTKTTQGKIATILYSAFGVPLMMLFVANIGSTMAKMFAFVFSRITMIFCCRMSPKKKRASALKNRSKLMDEKPPLSTEQTKFNLKSIQEESKIDPSHPQSTTSSTTDIRALPADVRLNMLTGVSSHSNTSRSLTSSVTSIGGKSKDAIVRMNELIRGNSDQHLEETNRRNSLDMNPIQYYINETNKLTSNLDTPVLNKPSEQDESNMKQVVQSEEPPQKSKKNLKRSKSESSHNRRSNKNPPTITNENESTKPARRGFFSRQIGKLKGSKPSSTPDDALPRKSQSFHDHSPSALPPPPDYEQPTHTEITPLPASTTVTWKGEHEIYPTIDLTNPEFDDDYDEDEEMSVPLLVTFFVIPLYLTLGAILFSIWENWSFLDSFYFCFITVTTIGFGDFVPGAALTNTAEKEKLISASAYILFGLVLIAMCVNLMKEQLSQKVKRVANKLGRF